MRLFSDVMSLLNPCVGVCSSDPASEVSMEVMLVCTFFCICAACAVGSVGGQGGKNTVLQQMELGWRRKGEEEGVVVMLS